MPGATVVASPTPMTDQSGNVTFPGQVQSNDGAGNGTVRIGGSTAGTSVLLKNNATGFLYCTDGGGTYTRFYCARVLDGTGNGVTNGATTLITGSTKVQTSSPLQVAGASGGTIYSGTGAPTVSGVNGDLYLRTDGATGSRLYVCSTGTTWLPVSGV